jgi:hypothetical protein
VGKEISERSSFVTVYTQQGRRLNKLMSDMVSKVITKRATIQVYNDIMGGTDQSGMMFIVTDHIGGVRVSELSPPDRPIVLPPGEREHAEPWR